jgi:YggT family protein
VRIVGDILYWILLVYMIMIVARILIEWLPVKWPRPVRPLVVLIYDLTEPPLSLLRRFIPVVPVGSGAALDFSPMVVIIIIVFLQFLVRKLFG